MAGTETALWQIKVHENFWCERKCVPDGERVCVFLLSIILAHRKKWSQNTHKKFHCVFRQLENQYIFHKLHFWYKNMFAWQNTAHTKYMYWDKKKRKKPSSSHKLKRSSHVEIYIRFAEKNLALALTVIIPSQPWSTFYSKRMRHFVLPPFWIGLHLVQLFNKLYIQAFI